MAFVPTTWNDNELVTATKLNQMADNDDYLLDHITLFDITSKDGTHSAGQLFVQAGLHDLFGGTYTTAQSGRIVVADVTFPTPFRYRPIVATSYVSEDVNYRECAVMIGSKNSSKQPDKDGFKVHVTHNQGSSAFPELAGKFYIHYIAVGIKA